MGNNPWVNFHPMLTFGNTVSFSKARPFAQVTQIFTIHVVRLGPGVVGPNSGCLRGDPVQFQCGCGVPHSKPMVT